MTIIITNDELIESGLGHLVPDDYSWYCFIHAWKDLAYFLSVYSTEE